MKIRQLEGYSTGNPQSYPQALGITYKRLKGQIMPVLFILAQQTILNNKKM